jgi:hypothetical protein
MKNISILFPLSNPSCNTCNHSVINLTITGGAVRIVNTMGQIVYASDEGIISNSFSKEIDLP